MKSLNRAEDEVNPVMSAVLSNGLDVTALHNHFFWEQPRMFYMHVHGRGSAADLTRRVKPAIDLNVSSLLDRWRLDSNQVLIKLQYAWRM